jgi:hypothetical protein
MFLSLYGSPFIFGHWPTLIPDTHVYLILALLLSSLLIRSLDITSLPGSMFQGDLSNLKFQLGLRWTRTIFAAPRLATSFYRWRFGIIGLRHLQPVAIAPLRARVTIPGAAAG